MSRRRSLDLAQDDQPERLEAERLLRSANALGGSDGA
jgi:hypothetical protein